MCLYLSPRRVLKNDGSSVVVMASCGHCIECLKRRQNDWKLRIAHESESWSHFYFFTLTYKDDMLPCNVVYDDVFGEILYHGRLPECRRYMNELNLTDGYSILSTAKKEDVQLFIKRMREDITRNNGGERWKCKYFCCAEYGPNPRGTKRPHYHGILLCNSPMSVIRPYFSKWESEYGRIDLQEVGINRDDKSSVANYISKYCCKGGFESRKEDIDNCLIECAWSVMSKNIGADWLDKHKNDYLKFVPTASAIGGAWSEEDVERFFAGSEFPQDVYDRYKRFFPKHELKDYQSFIDHWDLRRTIIQELDNLIRNMRVYDGKVHAYKMPRYYFDRIINKVRYDKRFVSTNVPHIQIHEGVYKPCFCLRDNFCMVYKHKEVRAKRFVPESFLSRALAHRLRMLALERDRQNSERLKNDFGYSDSEIILLTESGKRRALFYREKVAESQLYSFYFSNMWNHREFDE